MVDIQPGLGSDRLNKWGIINKKIIFLGVKIKTHNFDKVNLTNIKKCVG